MAPDRHVFGKSGAVFKGDIHIFLSRRLVPVCQSRGEVAPYPWGHGHRISLVDQALGGGRRASLCSPSMSGFIPASGGPLLLRFGRATKAAWLRLLKNGSLFGINAAALAADRAADHCVRRRSQLSASVPAGGAAGSDSVWTFCCSTSGSTGGTGPITRFQFLWRFHSVHHLDETLDTSSAVRFHFGEVVLSALVRGVVIVLFDLPLASVLVFEAVVLASAIFHHSDAKLPDRGWKPLSRRSSSPLRSTGSITTPSARTPTAITARCSAFGICSSNPEAGPGAGRTCRSASRA